jgi:predicted nucleotidyltransferase component of viral defense system
MLSREQLQRAVADSGFQIESYEKVHVLVRLLEAIRAHPFLGPRMALKGGTALNLFVLGLPRLSVDIDLNYVGASDRETMLSERPRVEQALQQVAGRMGLAVKRAPNEHAGGKWRLAYTTALGRPSSIEVDVNFMLRTPLWPPGPRDSHPIGGEIATKVLVVEDHELAAGKLAALVARSASRDVFDAREILRRPGLDRAKLRLGFVVYGGLNRVDWREITVEHVHTTAGDVDSQLVPMLRFDVRPAKPDIASWTEALVRETRELMAAVLPLDPHELEFVERLNGKGDIAPELLTADAGMQAVIQDHPGLKWKALNVKKRIGAAVGAVSEDSHATDIDDGD